MAKLILLIVLFFSLPAAAKKQKVTALYMPLADHYAALVAKQKYQTEMLHAELILEKMPSWPLLRAKFNASEADIAFVMAPLAMDMFTKQGDFRWVSLMHRDGNALAINELLNKWVELQGERNLRLPNARVADAFKRIKQQRGRPTRVGVPDLLSTHSVVLYRYLKEHGLTLGIGGGGEHDVIVKTIPPADAPLYLKRSSARGIPASFEQSLPWADIVETQGYGHVAWYSKDIMRWSTGHVECIVIAKDESVLKKFKAIKEIIRYIHQAGKDIEVARRSYGDEMADIIAMIRQHVPEHSEEAISQSLRVDLNVINYRNLNLDFGGLKQIMDYAVEGKVLKEPIDIKRFADSRFETDITAF